VRLHLLARLQQIAQVELGDVRARALARLDDPEVEQPAQPLAQARARNPQLDRQLALGRQTLAGLERALGDQRLQPFDHAVVNAHRAEYIGLTNVV